MSPARASATSSPVADFLVEHRRQIVEAADEALGRLGVDHYRTAGPAEVHRRLEHLYDRLVDSIAGRDLGAMVEYAQSVAEERFEAGFDLSEVQAGFNALEEATWTAIVAAYQPEGLAQALGLVSTVLGCGKDALARRYVSLATRTRASSLDLRALFSGGEAG